MVTDPQSKTRSFDVTLHDGTSFKISERAGKTETDVAEGSKPEPGADGEPAGGELGTAGRNTYRIPFTEATKRSKGVTTVDPKRILKIVGDMVGGRDLMHKASLVRTKAADTFVVSIPAAEVGKPAVELTVKIEVRNVDDPMWAANSPNAPHGGDFGPARLSNLKQVDGKWTADITVNAGLASEDVARTVKHELNEASDILSRFPNATEADITRESAAGVFRPGATEPLVTAHDRAAAHELKSLDESLVSAEEAHKPDAELIGDRQAHVDRMLRSMGLDGGSLTPEQRKTLNDAEVRQELINDIVDGGPAKRRNANFDQQLGGFREAQPFMSAAGGRSASGHARSKHFRDAAGRAKVLEILNNPTRRFTGTYAASGRNVDIYWARDSVVITEAGQKDRVITAYGPDVEAGSSPVPALNFRPGTGYTEIIR
jgi:hypothetical protein